MNTIVAISTPYGTGGIAVARLSGPEAFAIADKVWQGKPLSLAKTHTAHLGYITSSNSNTPLDQAVATVFRGPKSFTGEDTVEFSIHGSKWLQRKVVERLIEVGARPAEPGEFTRRAFLNGNLDLAQAEGVADMIASSSEAAHKLAMSQLSGGFSARLNELREKLIDLASLLELELDFSEEDVEFADRDKLRGIADETLALMERLASTYAAGRAFKEGVPVAIAGNPNAGKSTLLNRLLGEEKAIVSDIPGTTRDVIEDTREIGGVLFRFYDTAGLRDTEDTIERIGIERARDAISKAAIILWLVDATEQDAETQIKVLLSESTRQTDSKSLIILTKSDLEPIENLNATYKEVGISSSKLLRISSKSGEGIDELERRLVELSKSEHNPDAELIITNARHYEALKSGAESLRRAREAMDTGLSADFIAQDIRETLHHLGLLTGAITTPTLLATIFTRFCIGK